MARPTQGYLDPSDEEERSSSCDGSDDLYSTRSSRKSHKDHHCQHGRWSDEEHQIFVEALKLYGRDWKKVGQLIKSRTSAQIRSHAQKYYQRLARREAQKRRQATLNSSIGASSDPANLARQRDAVFRAVYEHTRDPVLAEQISSKAVDGLAVPGGDSSSRLPPTTSLLSRGPEDSPLASDYSPGNNHESTGTSIPSRFLNHTVKADLPTPPTASHTLARNLSSGVMLGSNFNASNYRGSMSSSSSLASSVATSDYGSSIDTYSNGLPAKPALLPDYANDLPSKPLLLPAPLPASRLTAATAPVDPSTGYAEAPILLALSKVASAQINNLKNHGNHHNNHHHSIQHFDRTEFERELRESERIALEVLCGKRTKMASL